MWSGRLAPWLIALAAAALLAAAAATAELAHDVGALREDLRERVTWMVNIGRVQSADYSTEARRAARAVLDDPDLRSALADEPDALAALDALRAGDTEAGHPVVRVLRVQTNAISTQLGVRWEHLNRLVVWVALLSVACIALLVGVVSGRARELRLHEALRELSERRASVAEQRHATTVIESRRNLQSVIEAMPVGVAVMQDDAVVYANPALARLLDAPTPHHLIGKPLVVDTPADISEPVPLTWNDAPSSLAVVRDLAEWTALQGQLRLADRLASIGTMASGIAHEINNPLTYVLVTVDELATALAGDERATALLDDIRHGTSRIRGVVRDLATFIGRDERTTAAATDLRPLLQSTARIATYQTRHRVSVAIEGPRVPPVAMSEARLSQVFLNVMLNAVQAVAPKGADHPQVVWVFVDDQADGTVRVDVIDEGPGIPAEHLERLFDPFFTTKPVGDGTGLGLYICHQLVTGVGGRIEVTSTVGTGTRVRLVLPVAASSPLEGPAARPPVEPTVLVVDDEPRVGKALSLTLASRAVTVVQSVAEARTVLEGASFDVILCDMNMPGEPGRALLDWLDKHHPAQAKRLLFITGGVLDHEDQALLERRGMRPLLKPFDKAAVASALAQLIGPSVD